MLNMKYVGKVDASIFLCREGRNWYSLVCDRVHRKSICNACHPVGGGNLQRHFKDLEKYVFIYGRVTAIHGNMLLNPVREST